MVHVSRACNAASITGLMLFGTLSSLLSKIAYQVKGEGSDGQLKFFKKPWATTVAMFIAMALCLPLAYFPSFKAWLRQRAAATHHPQQDPLLPNNHRTKEGFDHSSEPLPTWRSVLATSAPMAFDLVATVLMSVGLLYVTASTSQMLRGAGMLITAVYAVCFLGRKLNFLHKWGLLLCTVGITLVGWSTVLSGTDGPSNNYEDMSKSQLVLGMGLILLSQAVQAGQTVVEDYFMSSIHMDALMVVGWEGLWGWLVSSLLLVFVQYLPGKEGEGFHEDSFDTWHMIMHSPHGAVPTVLLVQMAAVQVYNVAGMYVTEAAGAVARSILETLRTMFVWLAGLALYYTVSHQYGEFLDQYSWIQAVGFAILVAGTVVYAKGDDRDAKQAALLAAAVPMVPLVHRPRLSMIKITSNIHTAATRASVMQMPREDVPEEG